MLRWLDSGQPAAWLAAKLALVVVALAASGEAGHQLLSRLGCVEVHHAFHLIYPAAAVVVFGVYLVEYIRRDGWPVFSLRLRLETDAVPSVPSEKGARERGRDRGRGHDQR